MHHPKRHSVVAGAALAGLVWISASRAVAADVVAVVGAASPLIALGANELADTFLGRPVRLSDGGTAVPIDQAEHSPARKKFYETFTGKSPAQLRAHWSKIIFTGRGEPPREVADGAAAKRLLASNPNAIAYLDSRELDDSVRVLQSP